MDKDLKGVAQRIFDELKDLSAWLKEKLDGAEWGTITVSVVYEVISRVIEAVEKYSSTTENLTGEEKNAVAVMVVNWLVDIPLLPEWLEENVLKWAISLIVSTLNKYTGKDWVENGSI